MKLASILYAVEVFQGLQEELGELAAALSLPQPRALLRQKTLGGDQGWACTEIGLTQRAGDYVFWGKFAENGQQHVIVFDPETLDSIEFETYDK